MGSYKLSADAKKDLQRIYQRGYIEFGEQQADKYFYAMFDRFEQITQRPYLYQSVNHIREGYRRSVCGVDSIYYRVSNDVIEVMRIIGAQDTQQL